jgi:Domain of unknown function (DUF222)
MFDSQTGGLDAARTLSLVGQAHRQVLEQECGLVELAAHWADLHHPDSQAPAVKPLPGAEQGRQLGGEGTPEVLEFAAAELGAALETSFGSARALMADALDLRHRLPQLWRLIVAGGVASWRARKVAQATRHLSRDSAMHVDAAVAPSIVGLSWGRLETLLAAKIIEADPKAAEEQAKIQEAERFVRAGRTSQSGLKLLIAKANAGDVTWFMATVNRIAEILRLHGDMESADVRRSKAIGILAQPAVALQLLWEFRHEQHPASEPQQPDEPITNEAHAPYDHTTATPDDHTSAAAPDDLIDAAAGETLDAEVEPAAAQRVGESPAERVSESAEPPGPLPVKDSAEPPGPVPVEDSVDPAGRGLIIRPPGVDVGRLRPQVTLHIHLSEEALLAGDLLGGGVARLEGAGPVTLGHVQRFLRDTGCEIKVQPVIDPHDTPPVDGYEIPRRIREAMFLRMPASCFPYAAGTQRMDLDHTQSYLPPARGGPVGQTGVHNLGPLTRLEHRVKTHSRWRVRQPEPGVWIWRSPHHAYYLVSNAGTQHLGDGLFARKIWKAAAYRPSVVG